MSKVSNLTDDSDTSADDATHSQRSLGMTEAGIGLSLITLLLVVLGYVIIQRVGDRGHRTTIEIAPTQPVAGAAANPAGTPRGNAVEGGQNTESNGAAAYQTSYPPQWLRPQDDASIAPSRYPGGGIPAMGVEPIEPTAQPNAAELQSARRQDGSRSR